MGQARGHCYIDFLDSQRLAMRAVLASLSPQGPPTRPWNWMAPICPLPQRHLRLLFQGRPEDPDVSGHGARDGSVIVGPPKGRDEPAKPVAQNGLRVPHTS